MRFLCFVFFAGCVVNLARCKEFITLPFHPISEDHLDIDDFLSDEASLNTLRVQRGIEDDAEIVNDDHFKCKQHSRKSCCGKSSLFKHFADYNKTTTKACYEEVSEKLKQDAQNTDSPPSLFSCEKYKMMKKLQYCASECIGKRRNIVNEYGNINAEEMKNYIMNDLFKETWQKELAEKIFPKCLNEKYMEWPQNEPGMRCNPVIVEFQHCLWKEFELNCPPSEQKDSKKCNKLRSYLKQQSSNKKKV